MELELHPLCTLFPRMAGAEFSALVQDIIANGQREPIITHGGMILDGGNRYRACLEAGIEPQYMKFGGDNVVSYVLSANLHRRHMTSGQMAAIVASCQDWAKAQSANRPEKAGTSAGLSTIASRSAASGAGERTQRKADKVAKADLGLAKQVAHGEVSLNAAVAKIDGKKKKTKRPKAAKAPSPEPEEQYDPRDDQLSGLAESLSAVSAENEDLKARLAIEASPVSEEEKTAAVDLIAELRKENKTLKETIKALTSSRDRFQAECAQHKRQIQRQRRDIEKMTKKAA